MRQIVMKFELIIIPIPARAASASSDVFPSESSHRRNLVVNYSKDNEID